MLVMIDSYGAFVGKKSERLVIKQRDGTREEKPLFDIEQIMISSNGVSISSDAVRECMNRGVQIVFANRQGQPYGVLSGPELNGTVKTRRAQLMAYHDQRGVNFAKEVARAKVQNQINTIKYFLKSRKEDESLVAICETYIRAMQTAIRQIKKIDGDNIDAVREQIMAAEGHAGRSYWQAVSQLLPAELAFDQREHRGARNQVNMMLNYGYGILYSKAWQVIILAGLDPYGGFLHVDRPGKPSLVLDFVEEFRQAIVDRVVLASLLRGFRARLEDDFLDQSTRRELAARINERLKATDRYEKKKMRLQNIMLSQARRLATFLRGEAEYKAHIGRW